jgi:hypothetical protein
MPWNAKSDARKLGPGIPKSDVWASAKEGIDQVGCVSTAQMRQPDEPLVEVDFTGHLHDERVAPVRAGLDRARG